jgi:hypothetical protein
MWVNKKALEETDALFAAHDEREHHHFPLARPLQLRWSRGVDGQWVSAKQHRRKWEIVCPQCGDTDGPTDQQSSAVQRLRGPYAREWRAKAAKNAHFDAN